MKAFPFFLDLFVAARLEGQEGEELLCDRHCAVHRARDDVGHW